MSAPDVLSRGRAEFGHGFTCWTAYHGTRHVHDGLACYGSGLGWDEAFADLRRARARAFALGISSDRPAVSWLPLAALAAAAVVASGVVAVLGWFGH